jgi:hypothetical protein
MNDHLGIKLKDSAAMPALEMDREPLPLGGDSGDSPFIASLRDKDLLTLTDIFDSSSHGLPSMVDCVDRP